MLCSVCNFGVGFEHAWELLCIRFDSNNNNYELLYDVVSGLKLVVFCFLNIINL